MDKEKTYNIMKHMYILISSAKNKNRMSFYECEYKWHLGFNVVSCLVENQYTLKQDNQMSTVFGVIIEIDFKNPDVIELWKNITNDV